MSSSLFALPFILVVHAITTTTTSFPPCKSPSPLPNIAHTTQPLLNSAPHLSMEERDPQPPPRNNIFDYDSTSPFTSHHDDDDSSFTFETPQQRPFRHGTYVIQVPKDQVYRVPPPEHAVFAERQSRLQPQGKRSCCSCSCVLISTLVILLILAITGGLCFVLIKKDIPNIRVDRVLVKNGTDNHHHLRPDYDITLGSENPNQHTSLLYGEKGDASLSFKSKEIATGKYPVFDQGPGSSTSHQIFLHGSNVALPKEIGHSMNSTKTKVHIDLSLQVKFPVKMKVGLFVVKSKMVTVLCSIKVDTLAKHTHILSQDCKPIE